jgi:hydroxyacylglutathione hydrolase
MDALSALPGQTRVCCAHEYTLSNLKFAMVVEPDNLALQAYVQQCQQRRSENLPTLPAQLATELKINPFLRSRQGTVVQAVLAYAPHTPNQDVEIFANLRSWKNDFK